MAISRGFFLMIRRPPRSPLLPYRTLFRSRAYLGASNPKREPHPFTNFDPADNFPMQCATDHGDFPHDLTSNHWIDDVGRAHVRTPVTPTFRIPALACEKLRVGYQKTAQYA